jgi:hypothetical protein
MVFVLRELLEFVKKSPTPATVLSLAGLIAWVSWAHSEEGFARKDDLAALQQDVSLLKDEVRDGRAESIAGQLFDAKVQQCKSTGEMRKIWAQRVSKLLEQYRKLTSQSYDLPSCEDL